MQPYNLQKYFKKRKELMFSKDKNDKDMSKFIEWIISSELNKLNDYTWNKEFTWVSPYRFTALCNWNYWDHLILLKRVKNFIPKELWYKLRFSFVDMYFGYCVSIYYDPLKDRGEL